MLITKTFSPRLVFKEAVEDSYELVCCDMIIGDVVVRMVTIYRTPTCTTTKSEQMVKTLGDLLSCNYPCILCGDFNVPDIKWDRITSSSCSSTASKEVLEFCQGYGLLQYVRNPTLSSHILDLILTNEENLVRNVKVEPPIGNSDHALVKFELNYMAPSKIGYFYKRNYKLADLNKICGYLSNVDWYGSFNSVTGVNAKYELFLAVLNHCIELFVPMMKTPLRRARLPLYLQSLFKKKSDAWSVANACTSSNSSDLWNRFRTINDRFEKKLRKFFSSIERKVVESGNKNEFYKFINTRIEQKAKLSVLVGANGAIAKSDIDRAELLAETFSSTFSTDKDSPELNTPAVFPVMDDSFWCNKEELYDLLSKWPESTSVTPDHIPVAFFKSVAHIIVGPLEYLFNLSFMRAEVPSRWKMSYVTPIPKKPPYSSPENYRPVSITSVLARIFEKLLKKRIVNHLTEHRIIPDFQHGFQRGKSTVTAMLHCVNDWTNYLDNDCPVDVVYFDFAKAFDRVCHKKLLARMESIGVHPRIIAWIREFLMNRRFMVKVNETISAPRAAPSGVPQGGVLSPILFNIFTYDIPTTVSVSGIKCCAFADDLKLYYPISCSEDRKLLQDAINTVALWSEKWTLPLSKERTKIL